MNHFGWRSWSMLAESWPYHLLMITNSAFEQSQAWIDWDSRLTCIDENESWFPALGPVRIWSHFSHLTTSSERIGHSASQLGHKLQRSWTSHLSQTSMMQTVSQTGQMNWTTWFTQTSPWVLLGLPWLVLQNLARFLLVHHWEQAVILDPPNQVTAFCRTSVQVRERGPIWHH